MKGFTVRVLQFDVWPLLRVALPKGEFHDHDSRPHADVRMPTLDVEAHETCHHRRLKHILLLAVAAESKAVGAENFAPVNPIPHFTVKADPDLVRRHILT